METKLREARLSLGLSQAELARKARLAQGQVSEFETGRRAPWKKARLQLARALKVSQSDLFDENGFVKEASGSDGQAS